VRQFLAVELPASLRERLSALQSRLRVQRDGWRWVRTDSIHLTLRFLGEVDPELDERCRPEWRAVAAGSPGFRFRLGDLGRFPPGGRPRVLWVGVVEIDTAGVMPALAAALEQAARNSGFEPEHRSFRPHLTLARAARGMRPRWTEGVEVEFEDEVEVDRIVLYRSELLPAGARYTVLDEFPLGTAGDGA
jgi:2'-5' RNA ligase